MASHDPDACTLEHLNKTYKVGFLGRPVVACRDISFRVRTGSAAAGPERRPAP